MPNFSGKWTLQAQMQAIAAGTWTGIPLYSLFSWGFNNSGQLGQNTITNLSSPVQVGSDANWSKVAASTFSAAIKSTGTLWSWGLNGNGQLGQNDLVNRSSPVQVGALTDWSQVALGTTACFAIKTNGTLWSWGRNDFGQLGLGNAVARSSPTQVGSLTNWAQVSGIAGIGGCAAIKTDGTLWTWGANVGGALGLNISYAIARSSPVQVGALTNWAQVSGGYRFCTAVKTDGTLWSWGLNTNGQLGQNNDIDRSSPVQVGALTSWARSSSGNNFCAAIRTTGTLWTWGNDGYVGKLGRNTTLGSSSSPVQVGALTDWSQVAALSSNSLALKTNGTIWTWGVGSNGENGQNNTANLSSPTQVGSLTTWSFIGQGSASSNGLAINKTFSS